VRASGIKINRNPFGTSEIEAYMPTNKKRPAINSLISPTSRKDLK